MVVAALVGLGTAMPLAVSLADIPLPTTVTVFFHKGGKPNHKPVDFTVRCYGWESYPGQPGFPHAKKPEPYAPKEVYHFSGSCPDYGCVLRHSLYLNYRHIDYCDLEGTSDGRSFTVKKFGSNPVGTCAATKGGLSFEQNCELRISLPE
jgi:hypothetical protein